MRAAALTAALGALLATSSASAQNPVPAAFTVISPIFGQLVAFSMPQAFVTVFENTKGTNYIREAVLKGETVDDWTQMITVTGAKGTAANPKVSPESFASSMAGGFKSACPDSFTAKGFGPVKFGDQDAYVAVASCGRVESAPTSTAKPRSSSPSKATATTTRCNGPSGRRRQARTRSTRPSGRRGCAS